MRNGSVVRRDLVAIGHCRLDEQRRADVRHAEAVWSLRRLAAFGNSGRRVFVAGDVRPALPPARATRPLPFPG